VPSRVRKWPGNNDAVRLRMGLLPRGSTGRKNLRCLRMQRQSMCVSSSTVRSSRFLLVGEGLLPQWRTLLLPLIPPVLLTRLSQDTTAVFCSRSLETVLARGMMDGMACMSQYLRKTPMYVNADSDLSCGVRALSLAVHR
jgi:hypothetical protein